MATKRPRQPQSGDNDTALTTANRPPLAPISTLPESLQINFPDFANLTPTNWYRPSTSPVERVNQANFQSEALVAEEQGNGLDLLNMNLDNVEKSMRSAVKATKIGKLLAEYLVGLEAIKTVGVSLQNAQKVTLNEMKKGLVIDEKGTQLDTQLIGERHRTTLEGQKTDLTQLEINYYKQLQGTKEREWQGKLAAAEEKARLALQPAKA